MKKKKTITPRSIRQVLEKLQQRYKVFSFEDYDRKVNPNDVERDLLAMERLDAQFHVGFVLNDPNYSYDV